MGVKRFDCIQGDAGDAWMGECSLGFYVQAADYDSLKAALDWALKWHLSRVEIERGALGWGHAPSEAICDLLNASRDRILAVQPCKACGQMACGPDCSGVK